MEYELDHDGMTGLLNRKAFERQAEKLLQKEACAALMMLDIDDLKDINDTLGHEMGDRAILRLVQVLREWVPADGLLARRSGDEFLMLLPAGEGRPALQRRINESWHLARSL